jgi:hypothetical protein
MPLIQNVHLPSDVITPHLALLRLQHNQVEVVDAQEPHHVIVTSTVPSIASRQLAKGEWKLSATEHATPTTFSTLGPWGLALKLSNVFYTSAAPTPTGLAMHTVITGGVQYLTVTRAYPLLLFDLKIALEWDARRESGYPAQLEKDLKRTSDLLYDWTNGQAALGQIDIYHDAKYQSALYDPYNPWLEADVRIYATNRLRPSAAQGGVVREFFTEITAGEPPTITYGPGQIYMGVVWNRFGDSTGNLSEDWPHTLAHELAHYLLFLGDNYLGVKDNV